VRFVLTAPEVGADPAASASSSLRTVFAAGDVPRSPIKRGAFAVGEGTSSSTSSTNISRTSTTHSFGPAPSCRPANRSYAALQERCREAGFVLWAPSQRHTEQRTASRRDSPHNRRSVRRPPRAHMCRYGAPGGSHQPTFCARVRCAEVRRRSAVLAEIRFEPLKPPLALRRRVGTTPTPSTSGSSGQFVARPPGDTQTAPEMPRRKLCLERSPLQTTHLRPPFVPTDAK
jgi:hypothetical protein